MGPIQAADAAEEAVAAGVGKDRSVPAHLVAKVDNGNLGILFGAISHPFLSSL